LNIGQKYYLTFFVSPGGKPGFTYATNNMGAKFSSIRYNYSSNPIPVDNSPHINYNGFISDTLNWTRITGSFVADSAYTYIALGNFFDDINTDTFCFASGLKLDSYYFIDDVCLTTDSIFSANWTGITDQVFENEISIYPNPSNGQFTISYPAFSSSAKTILTVCDVIGKVVYKREMNSSETKIDLDAISKGIYFVQLKQDDLIKSSKIVLQ
jgi:hypothetical protein